MSEASPERHIARLTDTLVHEYEHVATPEMIEATVRSTYERRYRASTVTEFVPVLTEREARAELAARFHPAGRDNG